MNDPITLIGIGEVGGILARGFLRAGHPVYPITRGMDITRETRYTPEPALVVIAVGEQALHPVLDALPPPWRERCLLLQNELLPEDWARHDLPEPTVMSVWFEKKPGQDVKQVVATPVYGPQAGLVLNALSAVGIDGVRLASAESLLFELVRKNLYILTTNLCGLEVGGDVATLASTHTTLMTEIAHEVLDLQQVLAGQPFDRPALMTAMQTAFEGDPTHRCQGRSAVARLRRALNQADQAKLAVPALRALGARHLS
ncbi:hypothetical protein BI364_03485 [Acidihalobacter yilgarnensis]|uniref:Ketopantoate reductase N-terminal domain-containing protein n=1 Tax=Acidihalobacter yilgarnensis TaxID=2819280 RepID=A0A1D8IL44_9GAMM|nr:hypothetical protein [Acidihalobacter yilgarnensis]AOU97187.1 hypothetical protein BI364_03485 [Acidihalobacter yilgarnensis]